MKRPRPASRTLIALAGLLVLWGPVPTVAADTEGRRLAAQWCASCHQISPQAPTSDQAPPFPAMARDPAYTEARLRNWLSDPHPPMPNIPLSRREIDLLVRFIQGSDTP